MKFYYLRITDVQGYEIVSTGDSRKECLDNAWKYYTEHFEKAFSKKRWFEHHGIDERSCKVITIGDTWSE